MVLLLIIVIVWSFISVKTHCAHHLSCIEDNRLRKIHIFILIVVIISCCVSRRYLLKVLLHLILLKMLRQFRLLLALGTGSTCCKHILLSHIKIGFTSTLNILYTISSLKLIPQNIISSYKFIKFSLQVFILCFKKLSILLKSLQLFFLTIALSLHTCVRISNNF